MLRNSTSLNLAWWRWRQEKCSVSALQKPTCLGYIYHTPMLCLVQTKELEDLCAAQQNSLEEGEERFRTMQNEHDQLHHAALASKAQLVTAQAQVCVLHCLVLCT